jgi:hypothetical protein
MMEAMHLQGNESCLELENEQKMKEQPVLKKMSPMEGGQAGRQKMTSRATLISFDQNGEWLETHKP